METSSSCYLDINDLRVVEKYRTEDTSYVDGDRFCVHTAGTHPAFSRTERRVGVGCLLRELSSVHLLASDFGTYETTACRHSAQHFQYAEVVGGVSPTLGKSRVEEP